jgi:hypothetical protein
MFPEVYWQTFWALGEIRDAHRFAVNVSIILIAACIILLLLGANPPGYGTTALAITTLQKDIKIYPPDLPGGRVYVAIFRPQCATVSNAKFPGFTVEMG